jgi:hypothetical protein
MSAWRGASSLCDWWIRPPDMEDSCECIDYAVARRLQVAVHQIGHLRRGQLHLTPKISCCELFCKALKFDWSFGTKEQMEHGHNNRNLFFREVCIYESHWQQLLAEDKYKIDLAWASSGAIEGPHDQKIVFFSEKRFGKRRNNNHELETGFFVHKSIISAVKIV